MRRIFYLVCVLIVYGSLYPFHFVPHGTPADVIPVLLKSLHFVVNRGFLRDVLLNLIVYVPVGFFYVLDHQVNRPAWRRCLMAALAGAALSLCMEFMQFYFPPRTPSLIDLLDNTLSAAAGGVLGIAFGGRARQTIDTLAGTGVGRPSSALFLAIVWAAALFAPGDLGVFGTFARIRAFLAAPGPSAGAVYIGCAQWVAIGALAAAISGRKRAPVALLAFAAAMPFRFLVPGQQPHAWEFAGAIAAVCIWYAGPVNRRLTVAAIAAVAVSGLLVDGLRPWHFAVQANHFEWVPFKSVLQSEQWATSLLILLRKAAVYGTATWAVARWGLGIPGASVLVATLLASIEAIQIYLPGRTAETTDPVLALVVGLMLLRLDHKYGADPGAGIPPPGQPRALPSKLSTPALPAAGTPKSPASRGNRPPTGPKVWTGGRRPGI